MHRGGGGAPLTEIAGRGRDGLVRSREKPSHHRGPTDVRTNSPLRYPGGKSCLFDLTVAIIRENNLECGHYAEPFAGGCGLALSLLYASHVAEIHVNDLDPSIWSFWHSVLHETEDFIARVTKTPVTIDEWHRQREIHRTNDVTDPVRLGFAAFFLNRTNRSGIIKSGGVIGGLDQIGNYLIDCRFNVEDLSRRIKRVGRYKDRITLTKLDAINFLDQCNMLPSRSLLFIDPPYFAKGAGLYTNYYQSDDHARLSDKVLSVQTPWIVTYDDEPAIRALYTGRSQFCFDISYSLNEKRMGRELLVTSSGLRLPIAFDYEDAKPYLRVAA